MKENKPNILTRRIYRNKLRIKEQLYMSLLAAGFFCFIFFTHKNETNFVIFFGIIIALIIVSNFIAVIWHQYWIKKWRKELSDITGIDYTILDTADAEDNLTREQYQDFYKNKLIDVEKEVINKYQKEEKISFLEKGILLSIEAKFNLYKENHAIIYTKKFADIKENELKRTNKNQNKKR